MNGPWRMSPPDGERQIKSMFLKCFSDPNSIREPTGMTGIWSVPIIPSYWTFLLFGCSEWDNTVDSAHRVHSMFLPPPHLEVLHKGQKVHTRAGHRGLTATLIVWGAPFSPNSSLLILFLIFPDSLHIILSHLQHFTFSTPNQIYFFSLLQDGQSKFTT